MSYSSTLKELPADNKWHIARLPVSTDMNGMEVSILVHAISKGEGPTLTLLSGLHGNEWLHLNFFMELRDILSAQDFQGRVVMVPLANAVAFGSLTRNIQDNSDSPDANRLFPIGGAINTGLSEQIALTLAQDVLPETNYLLDFHLGIWGSTLGSTIVGIDYSDDRVNEESRRMSRAFGVPLIYRAHMQSKFPGPRASQPYAGEVLKIPCCGSFLGGAGFDSDLEQTWTQGNVQGVLNVMSELGMQQTEQVLPERYLVYESIRRLNPKVGGLLQPTQARDDFGREVTAGEVLGKVVSPFTFEVLEELTSPFDGYLGYWSRSYPVRPGDWAFSVIPKDHPGTAWLTRDEV
jgi:predicted deacylase